MIPKNTYDWLYHLTTVALFIKGGQIIYVQIYCTNVFKYIIGVAIQCDQIWEKPASMHTTARHTFHHQMIAVHID